MALVSHSYLLDLDDPARLRAQFARAADAWGTLGIRVLAFRRGLAGLPRLREAVLADLSEARGGVRR
jgi:hypothetical protein